MTEHEKRFLIDACVYINAIPKGSESPSDPIVENAQSAIALAASIGQIIYSSDTHDDLSRALYKLARQEDRSPAWARAHASEIFQHSTSVHLDTNAIGDKEAREVQRCADDDDIIYLLIADQHQATIISEDKHLLNMDGRYKGVEVVHPKTFIDRYRNTQDIDPQQIDETVTDNEVVEDASAVRREHIRALEERIAELDTRLSNERNELAGLQRARQDGIQTLAEPMLKAASEALAIQTLPIQLHIEKLDREIRVISDPEYPDYAPPKKGLLRRKVDKDKQAAMVENFDKQRQQLSTQKAVLEQAFEKTAKPNILSDAANRYDSAHPSVIKQIRELQQNIQEREDEKKKLEDNLKNEQDREAQIERIDKDISLALRGSAHGTKDWLQETSAAKRLQDIAAQAQTSNDSEILDKLLPHQTLLQKMSAQRDARDAAVQKNRHRGIERE